MERVEELARLAHAAGNGNPEQLEELLAESAGIVHSLCRARLGDTLAAEEAAGEALARAALSIGKLRDPQAYLRWIARITSRTVATVARRDTVPPESVGREPVEPRDGPAECAAREERARRIRAAIAPLPGRLKTPLLLHYVEDLAYREIAATLGVSLSTVARRIAKALARLERTLGERT